LRLVFVWRLLRRERAGELDEHWAEVAAIAQQIRGAAPTREEKSDRREISLRRVTELACEDEIVAPIVGRLAAPGSDMIECHCRFGESLTAVGAYGPMLLEKPSPRFGVSDSSRWM
jgi:hypothetical protein